MDSSASQQGLAIDSSSVRGRKDSEGQEMTIKITPLKKGIGNLINLKKRADDAKDALNDGVKAVAEQSGLLASVVRKLVNARSGDKFEEEKRKVEQLGLVFAEVGEETFRNMDVGNGKPAAPKLSAVDATQGDAPIGAGAPPEGDTFANTDLAVNKTQPDVAAAGGTNLDKLSKQAADAATKPLSTKPPRAPKPH